MKKSTKFPPGVMQHYTLTKNWKSELDYLIKESKFLHHLFEGYYLNFSSDYYIKQLKAIECALGVLDRNIQEISGVLELELFTFDQMINGQGKNYSRYRVDLVKIEKEVKEVQLKFRAMKELLFQFVENTEDRNETFSFLDKSA